MPCCFQRQRWIETLLEARRRFGPQAEACGSAAYHGGMEGRHLEQQLARVLSYLRSLAPHDPRERHRFVARTDQQVAGLEFAFFAVEGCHGFTLARVANYDAFLRQLFGVEGVVGLTEVEHDEIGEIDNLIDRTLSHRQKQKTQPVWRGQGPGIFDRESEVAAAGVGIDSQRKRATRAQFGEIANEGFQGPFVDRRNFGCDAPVPPKVGAMGEGFVVDLDHPIVDLEGRCDGNSDFTRVGQDPDPLVIVSEFEFPFRADHAPGLDAANLRLLDLEVAGEHRTHRRHGDFLALCNVGCTTYDRESFALADVYLAQREFVRVRVRLSFQHESDPDVRQMGRKGFHTLDFGGRQREVVGQGFGIDARQLDVATEPAQ